MAAAGPAQFSLIDQFLQMDEPVRAQALLQMKAEDRTTIIVELEGDITARVAKLFKNNGISERSVYGVKIPLQQEFEKEAYVEVESDNLIDPQKRQYFWYELNPANEYQDHFNTQEDRDRVIHEIQLLFHVRSFDQK